MASQFVATHQELLLGQVAGRSIRLTPAILHASIAHARRIAADLGSAEAESSLAGYWSLDTRARQWQQIVDRVGPAQARQARFVEVGSGMGLFTLVGRALGFDIAGVEYSSDRYQASLQIARALFASNALPLAVTQARSEALPFPDASVDLAASFQTLEHVEDLAQTLREMRRILRPGGRLFAQAPNYTSWYEAHYGVLLPLGAGKDWVRRYLRLRGRPTGFLEHLQWLDPAALRALLARIGFASVEVTPLAAPASSISLPILAAPLPFRFRRGGAARQIAVRLAFANQLLGRGADRYPQLEIWAVA